MILTFLLALFRRKLTRPMFWEALTSTAVTTGMIYVILIGANVFNYFVVVSQLPSTMASGIVQSGWSDFTIIFVLLLIYIILGSIFNTISAMVITLPFVLPLIIEMGYSPIWWGIVNVVVIEIGMITPPIGINIFVLQGLVREYPLKTIFVGIVPYLCADVVRLALIAIFPIISLWLPNFLK